MGELPSEAAAANVHLVPFGEGVRINEGEVVPVGITLQSDRGNLSIPLGAFTLREGKTRFVPTVDIVGFAAVVGGLGVGALAVRMLRAVLLAWARRPSDH